MHRRAGRGPHGGSAGLGDVAPPLVHEVLRSSGTALPHPVRREMEDRLEHSFANVRIHVDGHAGKSARAVSALAYTVGRHVVFAPGQFSPGTAPGRQLIAHELTHVAHHSGQEPQPGTPLRISSPHEPCEQHSEAVAAATVRSTGGGAVEPATRPGVRPVSGPPTLWRAWESPNPGECDFIGEDRHLQKVVVDQEKAQSVTLHWSDGAVQSGMCSTGKGHCCTDAPGEVACSVSESRTNGSNCTPITRGAEYKITDREHVHNGWKYWNTFVRSRGIALHQHHTVTGTPLSHGCVRMHEETAKAIFCGALRNSTRVEVRGFARPDCSEPELQKEWRGDFRSAGREPSDGERPDVRRVIRRARREARRILRESYGRELTEEEIRSGQAGALAIPRCADTGVEPTLEERRAVPETGSATGVPSVSSQLLASSGLEGLITAFIRDLSRTRRLGRARRVVLRHGRRLWERGRDRTRGTAADTDDRALYWARLAMTRALRQWQPRFSVSVRDRQLLMQGLEDASRGITDITFRVGDDVKRIFVSGFDPFGLDRATYGGRAASNPSGAAALALDGERLSNGPVTAEVQSVVFPVRFADFDAGIVERVVRPLLSTDEKVDMVMTISMGGSADFEVEEYAGRRRQGGIPGNAGVVPSAGEPANLSAGPEFLRTSLPSSARRSLGRATPLAGESEVTEIPRGETTPRYRPGGPTRGSTSVRGSGGGYLSNEIFYRVALLRLSEQATVPVGHLHTPFLRPSTRGLDDSAFVAARDAIVARVRSILEATLPDL